MYLRERAYLRELAQRVAKESPHLADFLTLSHDPGIERVFEAFALLIARLRDKIEDDLPEITHGILSRIWPSALSPIPPTTVMQFHPTDGEHQSTVDIPAGTPMSTGNYSPLKPAVPCISNPLSCGTGQ